MTSENLGSIVIITDSDRASGLQMICVKGQTEVILRIFQHLKRYHADKLKTFIVTSEEDVSRSCMHLTCGIEHSRRLQIAICRAKDDGPKLPNVDRTLTETPESPARRDNPTTSAAGSGAEHKNSTTHDNNNKDTTHDNNNKSTKSASNENNNATSQRVAATSRPPPLVTHLRSDFIAELDLSRDMSLLSALDNGASGGPKIDSVDAVVI